MKGNLKRYTMGRDTERMSITGKGGRKIEISAEADIGKKYLCRVRKRDGTEMRLR